VPPPLGPACRGASATELQSQSGTEDALRAIVDDAVSLVLGTDGTKQNFSSILTPTDDRQHSQARESVSTTRASTGRRHPVRLTSLIPRQQQPSDRFKRIVLLFGQLHQQRHRLCRI